MAQAQLVTDPALAQTSVEAADILVGWRPIRDANGTLTGYQPYNITAANFATSIVAMGLLLFVPNWPSQAPEGGGFWLNNGALSYAPGTGTASGLPMTPEALAASLKALLAVAPAMGDATNFDGFQNNAGVATEVDDGT